MGVGPIGTFPFGWFGNTGGGGSSSSQGLLLVTGVAGQAGGPVAGATDWTPAGAVLVGATEVNVAIVNNVPEFNVALSPLNGFSFNSGGGSIDRAPNQWVAGDTIVLWYKPAP